MKRTVCYVGNTCRRLTESVYAAKFNYFATLLGSNTLAMLASFDDERHIIRRIFSGYDVPTSLISYKSNETVATCHGSCTILANSLTALLDDKIYDDLDKLLFLCIILNAKSRSDVRSIQALGDVVVYLNEKENSNELLLWRIHKLSYLHIGKLPILASEVREEMHLVDLIESYVSYERNLEPYSTLEQINKLQTKTKSKLYKIYSYLNAVMHLD
ncbi:hypothetical protein BD408DRAFT_443156 [Parasitella parasitica]|nr:hypothetical protein BD408DRAFT_443156 [Parasitella parasitica]